MLGHIILNVKDFSLSEHFYDTLLDALGWETLWQEDEEGCIIKAYGSNQGCDLMIRYDKKNTANEFVRNVGLDHICFKAISKDNIDMIHSLLVSSGATVTRSPEHYTDYSDTYYAFYFRDPSGIPLEVAYY